MDYIYNSVGIAISHIDGLDKISGDFNHEISPEQVSYYSYDGGAVCDFLRGYEDQPRFYASNEGKNSENTKLTFANLYKSVPDSYSFSASNQSSIDKFYCAGHRDCSILSASDESLYFPYNENRDCGAVASVITPELFFGGVENGLWLAGVKGIGNAADERVHLFLYGGYTNYTPVSEIRDGTLTDNNYYATVASSDFLASAILIPEEAYNSFSALNLDGKDRLLSATTLLNSIFTSANSTLASTSGYKILSAGKWVKGENQNARVKLNNLGPMNGWFPSINWLNNRDGRFPSISAGLSIKYGQSDATDTTTKTGTSNAIVKWYAPVYFSDNNHTNSVIHDEGMQVALTGNNKIYYNVISGGGYGGSDSFYVSSIQYRAPDSSSWEDMFIETSGTEMEGNGENVSALLASNDLSVSYSFDNRETKEDFTGLSIEDRTENEFLVPAKCTGFILSALGEASGNFKFNNALSDYGKTSNMFISGGKRIPCNTIQRAVYSYYDPSDDAEDSITIANAIEDGIAPIVASNPWTDSVLDGLYATLNIKPNTVFSNLAKVSLVAEMQPARAITLKMYGDDWITFNPGDLAEYMFYPKVGADTKSSRFIIGNVSGDNFGHLGVFISKRDLSYADYLGVASSVDIQMNQEYTYFFHSIDGTNLDNTRFCVSSLFFSGNDNSIASATTNEFSLGGIVYPTPSELTGASLAISQNWDNTVVSGIANEQGLNVEFDLVISLGGEGTIGDNWYNTIAGRFVDSIQSQDRAGGDWSKPEIRTRTTAGGQVEISATTRYSFKSDFSQMIQSGDCEGTESVSVSVKKVGARWIDNGNPLEIAEQGLVTLSFPLLQYNSNKVKIKNSYEMSSGGNMYGDFGENWEITTKTSEDSVKYVVDGIEYFNKDIVPSDSHEIGVVMSGTNNGVRSIGSAIFHNVPEVAWIDNIRLSAFPEYTFNRESSEKNWCMNGYSVNDESHEYVFGQCFNYGTFVYADGSHLESVYARAALPTDKITKDKYTDVRVSAALETNGNHLFLGERDYPYLNAIQAVYTMVRGDGEYSYKNSNFLVRYDFKRADGTYAFANVPETYLDVNGNTKKRNFLLSTEKYTEFDEQGYPAIPDGRNHFEFGPSFIPVKEVIEGSTQEGAKMEIYYPTSGLVGTVVEDRRYTRGDDGQLVPLSGIGASGLNWFAGNVIGISPAAATVQPPFALIGGERTEAVMSAVASGMEASARPEDIGSILWMARNVVNNDTVVAELFPTYDRTQTYGIGIGNYTNLYTSATHSYNVAIQAIVSAEYAWDGQYHSKRDWSSTTYDVSGYTTGYLWAPPEVKFTTPVVTVPRGMEGYVPWHNETELEPYYLFAAKGTKNMPDVTTFPPTDTVYRMYGFDDAGYYGIRTSGFVSAMEMDPYVKVDGKDVYRRKIILDEYVSENDIYVGTYESYSSAVLRTPISDPIHLDYTMSDLAIGPNEIITNDILNRRFEMLQHDLEQVQSVSRYYKNPPTKYLGYIGYGSDMMLSADYSMATMISLRDHYGFWNSGDNSTDNRIDWQWCRSSSGEFVCPISANKTSATIISGSTSFDIDDNSLNMYTTVGSLLKVGGMASYTQFYETSAHVVKDKDYSAVNATAPRVTSVKIMDNGKIFLLAPDFNRVLCYSRFDTENTESEKDLLFLYDFGGLGGADQDLRFNSPIALAVDNGVHKNYGQMIYILDSGSKCVKVFNEYGTFMTKIDCNHLKEHLDEHFVSLDVGVDGTICVLTNTRILFYDYDGTKTAEYELRGENPLQICRNKNANFVYVLYEDDVEKITTKGLYIGHFSVSDVWHPLQSKRENGVPADYGKFHAIAATRYDQIYLVMDNIVLVYADLLSEMSLASNGYKEHEWSLKDIKIGRQEYVQDWVVNIALHRMFDNIDFFRRCIYGRIRVREKNGIKYIKNDNISLNEYLNMQEVTTKDEVFVPSNAPVSAKVFNDNIKKLYDMIVLLLGWVQFGEE